MSINFHVIKSTIVGALGGLLFGFDTAVISGTTNALTQTYQLSPAMLGVTVSSALVGTVLGAITAGIPGQKFGRRDSLRVMAIFYVISALGCAFAWNWTALIFFRFIGGLGIGGSSVLGPMYIAEIAPPEWRGRLVGCFQLNVVIGILLLMYPMRGSTPCIWAPLNGAGSLVSPPCRRLFSCWRCLASRAALDGW